MSTDTKSSIWLLTIAQLSKSSFENDCWSANEIQNLIPYVNHFDTLFGFDSYQSHAQLNRRHAGPVLPAILLQAFDSLARDWMIDDHHVQASLIGHAVPAPTSRHDPQPLSSPWGLRNVSPQDHQGLSEYCGLSMLPEINFRDKTYQTSRRWQPLRVQCQPARDD